MHAGAAWHCTAALQERVCAACRAGGLLAERAYVGVCVVQVKTDVYGTAASIHTKYTSSIKVDRDQLAYGVALIPKKGGYVVAAVSG